MSEAKKRKEEKRKNEKRVYIFLNALLFLSVTFEPVDFSYYSKARNVTTTKHLALTDTIRHNICFSSLFLPFPPFSFPMIMPDSLLSYVALHPLMSNEFPALLLLLLS